MMGQGKLAPTHWNLIGQRLLWVTYGGWLNTNYFWLYGKWNGLYLYSASLVI